MAWIEILKLLARMTVVPLSLACSLVACLDPNAFTGGRLCRIRQALWLKWSLLQLKKVFYGTSLWLEIKP